MPRKNIQILILEDHTAFRDRLEGICAKLGKVWAVQDVPSALDLLARQSFRLLLLDWHLIQTDPSSFDAAIHNFQPGARRLALFQQPQLRPVIAAMKSGMSTVLWMGQDSRVFKKNIKNSITQAEPAPNDNFFITQLADSLAEKALGQKMSLSKARKDFSKTFLFKILSQKKMQRSHLASLMSISSRTLHRHLSP